MLARLVLTIPGSQILIEIELLTQARLGKTTAQDINIDISHVRQWIWLKLKLPKGLGYKNSMDLWYTDSLSKLVYLYKLGKVTDNRKDTSLQQDLSTFRKLWYRNVL